MEDKEGQTVGNKGEKRGKRRAAKRDQTGGALAGLDKECDYAPREQKEGKMKVGMDATLKRKLNTGSQRLESRCTSLC